VDPQYLLSNIMEDTNENDRSDLDATRRTSPMNYDMRARDYSLLENR
jgi:hypothetical protein